MKPTQFDGIQLHHQALLSMFSMVVDKFALALKFTDEWQLIIFAANIQLPVDYTEQLRNLINRED
jgi:hypothetical protein